MRRSLSVAVVGLFAVVSSGCGYAIKGASEYPGYIKCKGKGTITGSGQTSLVAGLGGAGQNTFSLTLDCGPEGIEWHQGKEPPVPAGSVVPPSPPK